MIDLANFKIRLVETMTWCAQRLVIDDPVNSLRSASLRPPGLRLSDRIKVKFPKIVNTICEERAEAVASWLRNSPEAFRTLEGGRLLLCTSVTESIPDGAVSAMSKGFYDEDDLPPWDTWICYADDLNPEYLISWVPPEWIEIARHGVESHFLDCMKWADMTDIELMIKVRN
jgi:hypothetical protein